VAPGEYVQLMVKDTGVGMNHDVMKRVFRAILHHARRRQGLRHGPCRGIWDRLRTSRAWSPLKVEPGVWFHLQGIVSPR